MVGNTQANGSPVSTSAQNSVYHQLDSNGSKDIKQFVVAVTPQWKWSRNLDYVFGGAMTKNGRTLYCKADVMVPFTFTFPEICYPGSRVRVRAEYAELRYVGIPVERCANHQMKDGSDVKMHFVRCEHAETEYFDSNGNCALSCSGGINRRPIQLTFILEGLDGRQLGTFRIPLKVCANPLRDASKEYKRFEPSSNLETICNGQAIQRKRPQIPNHYASKRTRFHDYPNGTCELIEIHFNDPRKASKFLWLLQNEDKLDQLLCLDVDRNPFRGIYAATAATSIKAWLNRQNIGLASFADKFERQSIFTLGDLARIYHYDIFAYLGFEPNHCTTLNKAFCDWYISSRGICAARNVEVNSGHGHCPQIL
ncbi:induces growth arrest or apoptosis depending on the physiological circumstances and cell type [Parelaphostrongylus tenuis]|uniref:Induces growth arrest or apoptosis depending on the physiological circumstances and cell type n=1 Tax=Parelaphostrongylus tenuis TaxID=148309 RepID=A0AAD5QKJ9_PARTN|nr:induces growth arrest or apoptosis depending on the physiological circumstances and cell type [Parelaphostrongylus tenuis]